MKASHTTVVVALLLGVAASEVAAENKPVTIINETGRSLRVQVVFQVSAKTQSSGLNSPEGWYTFWAGRGHRKVDPGETQQIFPAVYRKVGYSRVRVASKDINWNNAYVRVVASNGRTYQFTAPRHQFWVANAKDNYCGSTLKHRKLCEVWPDAWMKEIDIEINNRPSHRTSRGGSESDRIMREFGFEIRGEFYRFYSDQPQGVRLRIR